MPTSAIGSDLARTLRAHGPATASPGFTLLELMLVVLVVALTTALIAMRWPQPPVRDLSHDAERLAAQLDILRQQAASQGHPLIWTAHPSGYAWSPATGAQARAQDGPAASSPPTPWLSPHTRSQTPQLVLPGEPVSGPLVVELRSALNPSLRATVEASGLSPFKVTVRSSDTP
jgi:general secretion pathway protein H